MARVWLLLRGLLSKQVVENVQNVEDTFENQDSHLIPTPEDNQDDISQTRIPVSGNLLGSTEVLPSKNFISNIISCMHDEDELKAESQCGLTEKNQIQKWI